MQSRKAMVATPLRLPYGILMIAVLAMAAAMTVKAPASLGIQIGAGAGAASGPWPALYTVANPQQGFQAAFAPEGARVAAGSGAWRWNVSLSGYGRGDAIRAPLPALPQVMGQRVRYARGDLIEWYVNGPRGLEQGFTLIQPPSAGATGPVRLQLSTSGSLGGAMNADGASAVFGYADGVAVLAYSSLHVYDATGRELPSWLGMDGQALSIYVDDSSAVYPVTVDPLITTETRLTASDGGVGDIFGHALALDGGTLIVGAPYDDDRGVDSGAAYVYRQTGASWVREAKLLASDGSQGQAFGFSVDVKGDVAVVGAVGDSTVSTQIDYAGAIYVFRRAGATWTQEAKLLPSDRQTMARFGWAVATTGTTIVAGASEHAGALPRMGMAYVYEASRVGNGWTWAEKARLTALDTGEADNFGMSVDIEGDTILAGAQGHDGLKGAAYIFQRDASGAWTQAAALAASDGRAGEFFGWAVALSGNRAIVGAHFATVGQAQSGAAYVFDRDASGAWSQAQKLAPADGMAEDRFGFAVALDGDVALVTSPYSDAPGASSGAAYLFQRAGGAWTLAGKLTASDSTEGDEYGYSGAVVGDVVALGARIAASSVAQDAGAAYVYSYQVVANQPPAANAGGPYTVAQGALLTLNGAATDPNPGDPLTFGWDLDNDGLFERTGKSPVFSAAGLQPDIYNVALQVCDADGACAVNATTVTVIANRAPTALPGGPYQLMEGTAITLFGEGSDPDGDPLTYAWDLDGNYSRDNPPPGAFEAPGQVAVFPPPYDMRGAGEYPVWLQVCDSKGACAMDWTKVTVQPQPKPPVDTQEYALFGAGKDSLRLGNSARVSGGMVGGNGRVSLDNGASVENIVAGGDVALDNKAVAGDITSGGKVSVAKKATVGQVEENATLPVLALPAVNARPDDTLDVRREGKGARGSALALEPGSYGTLETAAQDSLTLRAGEYDFRSIDLKAGTVLTVDMRNSTELVVVRVAGRLTFGAKVQMAVLGGDASKVAFLVGGDEVELGQGGVYQGTFSAPNGKMDLGEGATLNGAAWGKEVRLGHGAGVTLSAFAKADRLVD